jgi:hypothetical protein
MNMIRLTRSTISLYIFPKSDSLYQFIFTRKKCSLLNSSSMRSFLFNQSKNLARASPIFNSNNETNNTKQDQPTKKNNSTLLETLRDNQQLSTNLSTSQKGRCSAVCIKKKSNNFLTRF